MVFMRAGTACLVIGVSLSACTIDARAPIICARGGSPGVAHAASAPSKATVTGAAQRRVDIDWNLIKVLLCRLEADTQRVNERADPCRELCGPIFATADGCRV